MSLPAAVYRAPDLLEIHPQQKAISMSGFSETDRVRTAKDLGAGAYVRKPYIKRNWECCGEGT